MIHESSYKEIVRLLLVIGSGILFAFLIALYFISYHSPSGKFFGRDVIVNPEVLVQLKYKDPLVENRLFSFDQINFSYFDLTEKKMKVIPIALETYQKFVNTVAKDQSVDAKSLNVINQFDSGAQDGVLTINVRGENGDFKNKIFQEITFSNDGNYYRVSSPYQNNEFTYFYHPSVYKQTTTLFVNI